MKIPSSTTADFSAAPGGHGRILDLDVLRGLAAAAVVLFHYTVRYGQLYSFNSPPAFHATYGFYGVELFFCISGFVIFMTLERTREPLDFVVSRVSRLWPAFLAAIVLTWSLVHIFGLPGRDASGMQALENATMIPDLLHVPLVDPVYWSLQVELIFYCWMLFAFATGLLRHVRLLLIASLIPPLIYLCASRFAHHELSYIAGVILMVKYIPFFVVGMIAYRARSRASLRSIDIAIYLAAVIIAGLYLSPVDGLIAAAGGLILFAASRGRLSWIARGPLIFLGTISYTLYLIHQNIGYMIIRGLTTHGVSGNVSVLLAIVTSVALATLLTLTIERPVRQWIRSAYRNFRIRQKESVAIVP